MHEYVQYVRTELRGQYGTSRVYLMGFSQGGMLACHAGIADYTHYAGLIIFGSVLAEDWLAEGELDAAAGSLPVFIAHGTTDEALPVQFAWGSRGTLVELGYDVEYHEFAGGHTLPAETLQQMQEWIAAGE